MMHAGEVWKSKGERVSSMPIPIGGVVTVDTHPVDRSHTDARRLPGVIVDISIHDEIRYYCVFT